jgi:predicted nucleic acid-binding protein
MNRMLDCLVAADTVVASELTLVECDRVLIRAVLMKSLTETAAADRRQPVRTSDALHLATAVLARSAVPGIHLLSLDERLRASARRLGFRLLPGPSV